MNLTRAQFDAITRLLSSLNRPGDITSLSFSRIHGLSKGRDIDLVGVTFNRGAGGERYEFHIDKNGNSAEVINRTSELMHL